MLCTIELLVI